MTALLRAALPIVAIVVFVAFTGAILATAGSTFGYDYQAYVGAAQRVLDGQALYDANVDVAGGFAIFLYPPPFAIALIPFALLPDDVGLMLWEALAVTAFVAGVSVLPVRPCVRWTILLLGGLDWPLVYAFKLGQVGPLLFLLFAIGWRWRERPWVLGASIAAGAIVKVQPVILLGWAVLTGRWRAVATGLTLLIGAGILATVIFGPSIWLDYLGLVERISSPIITPHNYTPGAIAYRGGLPQSSAVIIQLVWSAGIAAAVLIALRFSTHDASFVTTAVASQALSPLLWDHYAIVLLLPVAWLLERRRWWAVAIPLVTSVPLVGTTPALAYVALYAATIVLVPLVDWVDRERARSGGEPTATTTGPAT